MFLFRLLDFLIIGSIAASVTLAENPDDRTRPHYPVIYSNITEFKSENATDFPKHAEKFEIEYQTSSRIILHWKIGRGSLTSLQGFGIKVIRNYGISFITPPPTNISADETGTKFNIPLKLGYGSSTIVLYSLPYKDDCFSTVRKTVFILIKNDAGKIASKWILPIFVFTQKEHDLSIDFIKAPDYYNIDRYKICMQQQNMSRCTTVKKATVKFENIPDSNLNFSVIHFNRSMNINGTCSDDSNSTACMAKQLSYKSQVLCATPIKKMGLFSILSGIAIAILILFIVIMFVHISQLKLQKLEKKLVLLLHTSDNEIQLKAVESFIACLESLDIVVVRLTLPTQQEELQWLLGSFDNVILLDSLALSQRQDAWAVGKDYRKFLVEDHSKELTKNLFTVINICHDSKKDKRFLRCKWDFLPKESEFKNYPSNSPVYILPKNLKGLAEAIHGVSVNMNHCKLPKKLLTEDLLQEEEFTAKNPNWFQEKYGMPVCMENEMGTLDQPYLYPVLHGSDLISCVSSHMQQINEHTDKTVQLNQIHLNSIEVMSV